MTDEELQRRNREGVYLKGLTNVISIREFRGKEDQYLAMMKSLVVNGHSFAVHGGYLYLSASATQRLIDENMADPKSLSEEL
jgi:hypothetical protein